MSEHDKMLNLWVGWVRDMSQHRPAHFYRGDGKAYSVSLCGMALYGRLADPKAVTGADWCCLRCSVSLDRLNREGFRPLVNLMEPPR